MIALDVIKNPLATEKSIRLMESENTLVFVVKNSATKMQIKKAIEELFKAKIVSVNTFNSSRGQKRAYVKFSEQTPAIDIATDLGVL